MSRRIAHRPRYRNMRHLILSSPRSRQDFFHLRWLHRRQTSHYEKHALGYGISLIPVNYRLVHGLIMRPA
jgi:hypothetical protein